ncbi:MAG: type II toxin-antitoxin system HicB family antitoxin [Patescibacteria group bacterium]
MAASKKIKINVETSYGAFNVVLEPEPDMGGYMITVPKRPDVISWGKTLTHAKRMAREAIECSIEGEVLIAAEKERIITIHKQRIHA